MFDWTISIGNIIAGGTTFVGIIAAFFALKTMVGVLTSRLEGMIERMIEMESAMKRVVEILVVQGRQDERLNAMDGRLHAQGARIDEAISRINLILDGSYGKSAHD